MRTTPLHAVRHGCRVGVGALAAGAAVLFTATSERAVAQKILEVQGSSLTNYQAATSAVQAVRPRFDQRGVNLDGSARSGAFLGWSVSGNPFQSGGSARLGDIDLVTGNFAAADVDLALPSKGLPWVVGRTRNQVQSDGTNRIDSNGPQGKNWFQTSQPEIRVLDADGIRNTSDFVYILFGADRFIELQRTGSDVDTFKGKSGAAGVVLYAAGTAGEPDVYTYFDQRGNKIAFFGGNTSGNRANWQLWKMTDPAGNVTFVGDATTASTAVTSGYNANALMTTAYDASDRRYTYTYTQLDSVWRLTQVKAETKTGGTWASPTGVATVGTVDYSYYTGNSGNGDNGNLSVVTVTTPLSSGPDLVRKTHYRYWTGTFNATTNPGHPNTIKYVVDPEGYRQADWIDSNFNDTPLTLDLSIAANREYAGTYLEYDASGRVVKAWSNGECGCAGSSNGTYELRYETNTNYATWIGNTAYNETWALRTAVKQPDGSWTTHKFDETGQRTHLILTNADPNASPSSVIAREWQRSAGAGIEGTLVRLLPPEMLGAYSYSAGTFTYITTADIGSEMVPKVVASGTLGGFTTGDLIATKYADPANYVNYRALSTRDFEVVTGVKVESPRVDASRAFHTATTNEADTTKYDETTYTYTYHSATVTDPLYLAFKKITTTLPVVSTSKNGAGAVTTTDQYYNSDGRVAFTATALGTYTYSEYDTYGRLVKSIRDPKSGTGETAMNTAATSFTITLPSNGLHVVTTYTYDAQGRPSTTTLPDGRVMRTHYTRLADGRMVTLSIPREVAGGSTTYYGPVSYAVTNHAGKAEAQGTIAISASGTTTALSSWINTASSDPIAAISGSVGSLKRLSTTIYSKTGHQALESRSYFLIPASGAGASGTNYDATLFGYDVMGRQVRVQQPHGTISRTVYDWAGRAIESWTGTSDSGFAPPGTVGNMTKTDTRVYDASGRVTSTTRDADGDWSGASDQRTSTVTYNARGFAVIGTSPVAPHSLTKYDNLGRVLASATYSSTSGLTVTTDPTTTTTNRLSLSETQYDERGRGWKSVRHNINQSTGASSATIESTQWFDADGRTVKTDGSQLAKTLYDRLGRATHRFILASDNDTVYADADDVTGDVVVEEQQTVYDNADNSGRVMFSASISRHHNDIGGSRTTGALDSNADANSYKITAANVTGRLSVSATWYDALGRTTDTASYGSNAASGNGDFDRRPSGAWLAVPARSDTVLVSSTTYNTDGSVQQTTDPKGLITRLEYDDLGRQTAVIENYVNGTPEEAADKDDDRTIRFEYVSGLRTKYIADLAGTGNDQETIYTYGTTKGTIGTGDPVLSQIATGHLLRRVRYPDSTATGDAGDTSTYAYNALSEQIWTRDQSGNVIETDLDLGGRQTARRATNIIGTFDNYVQRIEMAYTNRGQVEFVRQRADTTGTGTIRDEVKHTYDGWGNLTTFEQDVDSAISGGGGTGRAAFSVSHTYAVNTSGRNTIRRATTTLPGTSGSFDITYDYASTGGSLANDLSRVSSLTFNGSQRVAYDYIGMNRLIGTDLLEPDVRSRLATIATWPTVPTYDNVDRFGRVTSSRWTRYAVAAADMYRVDLTYDRNSSILTADDAILTGGSAGTLAEWDVQYSLDNLGRVLRAKEGKLASGAVADADRDRDERWQNTSGNGALSPTGNWDRRRLDLNGDGDYTDAGEIDDTGTYNKANEWLTRDTDTSGGVNFTLTHDAVGNTTDDGKDYTHKYDAFGRLVEVKNRATAALVAEYRYNGLNFRIGWRYDASGNGSVGTTTEDPWYWFAHDERWRIVATFRHTDSTAKERFVWHSAGLDGQGGSSYIDSVILRDKDTSAAWTASADVTGVVVDGVLEERLYYAQNWRADVSLVIGASGGLIERVKYSAYGVPFCISRADYNGDGAVTSADDTAFMADYNADDVRADFNYDGTTDFADYLDFVAIYNGGAAEAGGGRSSMSSPSINNRLGYAGYQWDPSIRGSITGTGGASAGKYHVRHRVLDAGQGRWTRRDPMGYIDGASVYEYVRSSPVRGLDPMGLRGVPCVMGEANCGGQVAPPVNPPGGPPTIQPIDPPWPAHDPNDDPCNYKGPSIPTETCSQCCDRQHAHDRCASLRVYQDCAVDDLDACYGDCKDRCLFSAHCLRVCIGCNVLWQYKETVCLANLLIRHTIADARLLQCKLGCVLGIGCDYNR